MKIDDDNDDFVVQCLSRYTYGEPVGGNAVVYLSIAGFDGQIIPFARHVVQVTVFAKTQIVSYATH